MSVESTYPAPDGERSIRRAAIRAARKPIFDNEQRHFTVEDSFVAGHRHSVMAVRLGRGHVPCIDIIATREGRVTEKLACVRA
jgi:hypothetical protein